jgi:hypothetical protein
MGSRVRVRVEVGRVVLRIDLSDDDPADIALEDEGEPVTVASARTRVVTGVVARHGHITPVSTSVLYRTRMSLAKATRPVTR